MPKDEIAFKEYLNQSGFLLEDLAYNLLKSNFSHLGRITKNFLIEKNGEVEIDILFFAEQWNKTIIFEVKKPLDKSHNKVEWYFLRNKNDYDLLSVTSKKSNGEFRTINRRTSDFKTSSYALPPYDLTQNKGADTNRAIYDVATDLLDVINTVLLRTPDGEDYADTCVIPVLLTNAPLHLVNYGNSDIDKNGNLINYAVEDVGFLAYYHPKLFYTSAKRFIPNEGLTSLKFNRSRKTVFVVNVNHLVEFIRLIGNNDFVK